MGFATPVNSMVTTAISNAVSLFGDFWPLFAFIVGLWALRFIVDLFMSR